MLYYLLVIQKVHNTSFGRQVKEGGGSKLEGRWRKRVG